MTRMLEMACLLALGGLVVGCQTSVSRDDLTVCEDPRPQVCTREYAPVCGYLASTGEWKTYPNSCVACSVAEVEGWMQDACAAP